MRKLASIRRISEVHPIVGKDRVEMAIVDGWTCMVSKADNFISGDFCVFCEPDSVFPRTQEWEFLKKYNYRIKTQKFKDGDGNTIYSQGLVLPMSKLREKTHAQIVYKEGDDVTGVFEITQYEETRDVETTNKKSKNPLMRFAWFRKLFGEDKTRESFPAEVSKTDEERVQNCPDRWKLAEKWIATEKVDGQSGTFLLRKKKGFLRDKYEFVVCSRNMKTNNKNASYWKVAEKFEIKNALKDLIKDNAWVCLQGEVLGPGIQKNKYKFEDYEFRAFNLIFPSGRVDTMNARLRVSIASGSKIKWVPVLSEIEKEFFEGKSVNDILTYANGKSELNKDVKREGIVFRSEDGKHSFKAVSPEFLIKYDE